MSLREILVEFGIAFDTAELDKGNKKVEGGLEGLKKFGKALAGAFAVAKLKDFVDEQVSLGDELGDQAVLLDLSTKSLEQWRYAAQFAEISGEELSGMFMRVARSANSAENASSAQGKALKKLGINVKDHKSTADVFETIGTKLAGMKEGYERTALAAQFFGKAGGAKVLQLFKDGAEGIAKYREEFELLGGGMGDFAQQAGEVDDAEKRLNFAWGVTKTRIAGVFLPALEWGIAKLTKFAAAATKLIDGTHILGFAMTALAAIATAAAIRIVASYLPVIAPFLLWAAAIAAVVLIAEDLFGFFEGRRSLIGRVLDSLFGDGSADKVRAWFQAVWDFGKQAFDKLTEIFGNTTLSFRDKLQEFLTWLGGAFASEIGGTFGEICSVITAIFAVAIQGITAAIDGIVWAAEKAIALVKSAANLLGIDTEDHTPENDMLGRGGGEPLPPLQDGEAGALFGGGKPAPKGKKGKQAWFPELAGAAAAPSVPVPQLPPSWGDAPAAAPTVQNYFDVAPGTPQAQQRAIASAAERGTKAGLQAPNRAAASNLGRTGRKS